MTKEKLPLKGFRLFRWHLAIRIYRIGCLVSGRHEYLMVYDDVWKINHCPHCGWVED